MSVARCMFICIVLCIRPCVHTLLFRVVKHFKIWIFKKKYSIFLCMFSEKKSQFLFFSCILLFFNGLLASLPVGSLNVGIMLILYLQLSTLFQAH